MKNKMFNRNFSASSNRIFFNPAKLRKFCFLLILFAEQFPVLFDAHVNDSFLSAVHIETIAD
jgi:hypothetical protein